MVRILPRCKSISLSVNLTASVTRKPVAYMTSSKALSRSPCGVSTSGAASSASIWASVISVGSLRSDFGALRKRVGLSALCPVSSNQPYIRLQADNARAWDVFFSPSAYTASDRANSSALNQSCPPSAKRAATLTKSRR